MKQKASGMTLLEVLIAITLMVIIAAISYGSLNGLIDAKIHTDEVAAEIRQDLLVSRQLNNDFHSLIRRKSKDELGRELPEVSGNYSSVSFIRNGHDNPFRKLRSELQTIKWYLKDSKLYRSTLDMADPGSFPDWRSRVYLDGVRDFEINFINSSGLSSRIWPQDAQSKVPLKAIRIALSLQDGSEFNYYFSLMP